MLGRVHRGEQRSTSAVLRSVLTVEGTLEMDASVMAGEAPAGPAGGGGGGVGDPGVIGAGTYADDLLGAGSATGPGEAIIRLCLVRSALELVGRGLDPPGCRGTPSPSSSAGSARPRASC